MEFEELLKRIALADCKDNGREFVVTDRLDVIEELLEGSGWNKIVNGKLCHIYSRKELCATDNAVVISSHVDCVYSSLLCESLGEQMRGTFDNALTNTAVVAEMLDGTLGDNVVVVFTGDEERDSTGVDEVLAFLAAKEMGIRMVVVTDVTNVGWEHKLSFTIENDFNIDLLTAHTIVEELKEFAGKYGYVHEAMPDETWRYDEHRLPCLTLCIPVGGDMHADSGSLVNCDRFNTYRHALRKLTALQ